MTWNELKIITLQKCFAITDGKLRADDTTNEYLTAMPGAANEALALLSGEDWMRKRTLTIRQDKGVQVLTVDGDTILAPLEEGNANCYDLRELAPECYRIDRGNVMRDGQVTSVWELERDWELYLPSEEGTWTIKFWAWPKTLAEDTEDDYELPLYSEVATLLPLYMASQLYKDDDIAISTQYRNEFEVGREGLRNRRRRGTEESESWRSVTNWW